jgi:cyclophilin family peptidyl-prolyl cis-trans isomerase
LFVKYLPFILECNWLDGKHVVFGKVHSSTLKVLDDIEMAGSQGGVPQKKVKIADCGILESNKKSTVE